MKTNLKLNALTSNMLSEVEMNHVYGGAQCCACGCQYANSGGSSTNSNGDANHAGGKVSRAAGRQEFVCSA